jgi:adenine-specific DNA-methyltransferase
MSPSDSKSKSKAREIDQYDHKGQTRLNNPPVGLVTPETDKLNGKTRYEHDPHLDPQLIWAGKAEHTSFEVPRVSLHVHERIDPQTIIEAIRQRSSSGRQKSLFEFSDENPPLREAIEFYRHKHNWSNRLIAGDSLLAMNSLLEKEGMAGKIQMVYFDPPYGIKYGSNFQPFVNKKEVTDGKDADLTQEPEMVRAFRDTWELGIHSYLTYIRDRLLLARNLLTASGSVFVQISDENLHHVRELLDEVMGVQNFCSVIQFVKTSGSTSRLLSVVNDYLLWYCKDKSQVRYHQLFSTRSQQTYDKQYSWIELPDGNVRHLTTGELSGETSVPKGRRLMAQDFSSPGEGATTFAYKYEGREFTPPRGRHFPVSRERLDTLVKLGRVVPVGDRLRFKRYADEFPFVALNAFWDDTVISGFSEPKVYVVQTSPKVVERCILMTSDPGDLILDPTCGSGTTAYCAEKWGRRWITCDTSRVAIALAKQRLMTSVFEYYTLARPSEGVDSGFVYEVIPHVTMKSLAEGERSATATLYDCPKSDLTRTRVTGPFTYEAVPAPTVQPIGAAPNMSQEPSDVSVARRGETIRQEEWRSELLRAGIRGKSGQTIDFSRVEPLPATRWLHADAETSGLKQERAVVSFGPDFAPLEPRQVALAIDEALTLVPKPHLIIFAAFQFDSEAAKDIDETEWPGVTLLKVQMNPDLFTEDLKKKRASNQSFWLIGQPDVNLSKIKDGKDKGKLILEVCGFDYYNTKTGTVESGGTDKIALWMLDTDYDGRSLFPRQVFLPLAGEKEGWTKVARTLRGEINEEAAEAYRGTVSLPFELGKNKRVAIKIIDDRGIESLKVIEVDTDG